jgi:hypothetical protein
MSCFPPYFFSNTDFFPCAYFPSPICSDWHLATGPLHVLSSLIPLCHHLPHTYAHHRLPSRSISEEIQRQRQARAGKMPYSLSSPMSHTVKLIRDPASSLYFVGDGRNKLQRCFQLGCWILRIQWICLAVVLLTKLKYGKDEQNTTDAMVQVLPKFLCYYSF